MGASSPGARGWRAPEEASLGNWLLRAAEGFTGRANSALAVGDPGLPLAGAVDEAEAWYRARGLPPMIVIPGPLGAVPATDVKILTSCPSCLQGLSRYNEDAGIEADYIVVEMARHVLGEDWMVDYVQRANNGGIERVLV